MLIHDFSARLATGEERRFADYRGKVLLVVNVASKCGFTPQYSGLQALYGQYHPRDFEILAFPCVQFGHQEPGSDAEIANFCDETYGVGLPMRVFGLDDAPVVAAAIADIAVVANCAGPFAATSAPMIDACLTSRAHYLDITGE